MLIKQAVEKKTSIHKLNFLGVEFNAWIVIGIGLFIFLIVCVALIITAIN